MQSMILPLNITKSSSITPQKLEIAKQLTVSNNSLGAIYFNAVNCYSTLSSLKGFFDILWRLSFYCLFVCLFFKLKCNTINMVKKLK